MLVAIAIPVFTSQLEKSRESTDAANLRAAYAEVMSASLLQDDSNASTGVNRSGTEGEYVWTKEVPCKQTQTSWQNTSIADIGGVAIANINATTLKGWTVTYTQKTMAATFPEKAS